MNISTGILFGMAAMLGWGTSNFIAAKAVRETGVVKVVLWSQIVSLCLYLFLFPFFSKTFAFSSNTLTVLVAASLLMVIAYLAFCKGLQVGAVSVVSAVSSSAVAVTVLLSIVFLKQALTILQAIGVSLAIIGAVLTSFKAHDLLNIRLEKIAVGAKYGLIAMLGWGLAFVLIDILVSRMGWFLPVVFMKIFGVAFIFIYFIFTKTNLSFPENSAMLVIAIGLVEVIAFLSYNIGISSEYTSVIAPIAFAYPAITIILARIFFKEILETSQKAGVISVLAGLILLTL